MLRILIVGICFFVGLNCCAPQSRAEDAKRVLIVVGPSNHPPGTHEVAAGARLIAYCLEQAEGLGAITVDVSYGWPSDKSKLKNVDTLVFSGDRFPIAELENTEVHMRELSAMMEQGCGIVCYHYATGLTTGQVTDDGRHPLLNWMGGYFATRCPHHQSIAKIFEAADIKPKAVDHPVMRGVRPFTIHDEPYINNYFGPNGLSSNVTALATSMLPPENPKEEVIAWAVQRADGGRGMAIVMPHFYKNWQVAELRTMILNGIAWTAGIDVPKQGVDVALPPLERFAPESVEPKKRSAQPPAKPKQKKPEDLPDRTTVFRAGSDGYNGFRIPAIIRAANGDLLAFCEARSGGDASEIDLVLKRSTDQGLSWGPLQIVADSKRFQELFGSDPPPITVGNPAPVVDLLDPEHPGRIWLPFTLENDRVFVVHSDDHGNSWSERREITADVKLKPWGWYATGPCHSIQLRHGSARGRLVIPADHRLGEDGADDGAEGAQAILSDDHGNTWRLGAIDDSYSDGLNANETSVVELSDGRLLFNTRDQNGTAPGTRGSAYSNDGGETFEDPEGEYQAFRPDPAPLDPPVVQCSLLRFQSQADGDNTNLLLFSGPDESGPSGKGRSDLRICFSDDEARTWRDGPLLHTGPAAYSDMVKLDAARVGVVFECGEKAPYERIDYLIFKPEI